MPRLKVYRTAIGFHDAYVAAPNRKAALEAWGTNKDLFARGAAEVVSDEALTAEPLASPGRVIRRLRGSVDEQMAALPPNAPQKHGRKRGEDAGEAAETARGERRRHASPPPPPPPPPSRSRLDEAEEALDGLEGRARERLADLERRERALTLERRDATAALERERSKLAAARDREAAAYDRARRRWRAGGG